jgi:endonuclease I
MSQQKPTRKTTPANTSAKNTAQDKKTVRKVAGVATATATVATVAVARSKRSKTQKIIALLLIAVFLCTALGGTGWWFFSKTTINFYYVDDSRFEHADAEYKPYTGPELLDTVKFRLFTRTVLAVDEYFEFTNHADGNISEWEFEWYLDANCTVPATNLKVAYSDLGKTRNLYGHLVFIGTEGGEVNLPHVPEGNYPSYSGDYYKGVEWTVEWLYARLRDGFKATTYDFAGRGNGLVLSDTPFGEDKVFGIYNNRLFEQDWMNGRNFEREHVWPNSLLGMNRVSSTGRNQASDMHNLRAIGGVHSGGINQTRSNRFFTECNDGPTCTKPSGDHTGHTVGTNGFYPGDDHVGDVARILMYMIIMYHNILLIPTNVSDFATATAYSPLHAFMPISDIDLLRQWNCSTRDPVDDFERHRNDVLHGLQGNRNPFIDHPEKLNYVLDDVLMRMSA